MNTQRTPIRTATGAALLAIITVALAAGCYWTPQGQTGGISIAVDTGALSASAADGSSISASATGDADTFLFAYVIAESLLRGDPTAAESAFEDVNVALQDELSSFFEAQIGGTAVETGISTIDVGTDLVKAQVGFFSAGTGGGGTSSFSGLRAGERYLVVIAGSSSASQQEELFGFESVTIAGGETQTVPIALNRTQAEYNAYLAEEFGVDGGSTGSTAPATVSVTLSLNPSGYFGQPLIDVPTTLYYDVIDASSITVSLTNNTVPSEFDYISDSITTPNLSTYLTALPLLEPDGSVITDSSGTNRPSLPASLQIDGFATGNTVQILVTSKPQRGTDPGFSTHVIGISDPVTLSGNAEVTVDVYPWDSE